MGYTIPKNNFTAMDGLTYDDVNKQADNDIYFKGKADASDAHAADGTIHKTSVTIRGEPIALVIETRTSDPTSPATGRIWLRTDL